MKTIENKASILEDKILLVVDDDDANRRFLVDLMLKKAPKMTVLVAKHGRQALSILVKKQVNLILLDWEMPEMDGLATLEALQTDENWRRIPVVMYTGVMGQTEHLAKALALGAVDFLRKPANPVELLARIQSILYQSHLQRQRFEAEQALIQQKNDFLKKELEVLKHETNKQLLLLAKNNELLMTIKQQLETTKTFNQNTLKSLVQHIDNILGEENYWQDFLEQFNQMNPHFIKKITEQAPTLTISELRFCALLRCGLDSKTLASLLNITLEGIKKSRYRTRKKLGLSANESLEKYILTL